VISAVRHARFLPLAAFALAPCAAFACTRDFEFSVDYLRTFLAMFIVPFIGIYWALADKSRFGSSLLRATALYLIFMLANALIFYIDHRIEATLTPASFTLSHYLSSNWFQYLQAVMLSFAIFHLIGFTRRFRKTLYGWKFLLVMFIDCIFLNAIQCQ
jgi:hypothetical protein